MTDEHGRTLTFARPKDRSLAAYKRFILGMLEALTGKAPEADDTPEAEWERDWREFWAKAEDAGAQ